MSDPNIIGHADADVSRYRAAQWEGRPPCPWADLDNDARDIWRGFYQCHLDDIASGRRSERHDADSEAV